MTMTQTDTPRYRDRTTLNHRIPTIFFALLLLGAVEWSGGCVPFWLKLGRVFVPYPIRIGTARRPLFCWGRPLQILHVADVLWG